MTYGIRTTSTPPTLIHVSEVEAVVYTAPQHNRKRGWPKDVPTHWYCYCWGSSGYGNNPIQALASACENWVRWNEPEYVQKAIKEYQRGKETQTSVADSVSRAVEDNAGRRSDSADAGQERGVRSGRSDRRGSSGGAQGAQGHGAGPVFCRKRDRGDVQAGCSISNEDCAGVDVEPSLFTEALFA